MKITYGTFDALHFGHIRLLQRIGSPLIVGLSTDEFNKIKGKKCYQSYEERKRYLEAIRYVNKIIPETCWEQKESDIQKYGIKTLYMGDDWEGVFDHLPCEVIYLPRTKGISSTKVREIIC